MIDDPLAERLMRLALRQAALGLEKGEIPIGAVLAIKDHEQVQVLGAGYNQNIHLQRRTAHAEMRAFERARIPADLSDSDGDDVARQLILVSTLEPCIMCFAAAMLSAVDTIVFGLYSHLDGGPGRVTPVDKPPARVPDLQGGVLQLDSRALFMEWRSRHRPGDRHWEFVARLARQDGPAADFSN